MGYKKHLSAVTESRRLQREQVASFKESSTDDSDLMAEASAVGADPYLVLYTVKAINVGIEPDVAFALAAEDQNYHGFRHDIIEARREAAEVLEAFAYNISEEVIQDLSKALSKSNREDLRKFHMALGESCSTAPSLKENSMDLEPEGLFEGTFTADSVEEAKRAVQAIGKVIDFKDEEEIDYDGSGTQVSFKLNGMAAEEVGERVSSLLEAGEIRLTESLKITEVRVSPGPGDSSPSKSEKETSITFDLAYDTDNYDSVSEAVVDGVQQISAAAEISSPAIEILQEKGPGSGWPEVKITGSKEDLKKFALQFYTAESEEFGGVMYDENLVKEFYPHLYEGSYREFSEARQAYAESSVSEYQAQAAETEKRLKELFPHLSEEDISQMAEIACYTESAKKESVDSEDKPVGKEVKVLSVSQKSNIKFVRALREIMGYDFNESMEIYKKVRDGQPMIVGGPDFYVSEVDEFIAKLDELEVKHESSLTESTIKESGAKLDSDGNAQMFSNIKETWVDEESFKVDLTLLLQEVAEVNGADVAAKTAANFMQMLEPLTNERIYQEKAVMDEMLESIDPKTESNDSE